MSEKMDHLDLYTRFRSIANTQFITPTTSKIVVIHHRHIMTTDNISDTADTAIYRDALRLIVTIIATTTLRIFRLIGLIFKVIANGIELTCDVFTITCDTH